MGLLFHTVGFIGTSGFQFGHLGIGASDRLIVMLRFYKRKPPEPDSGNNARNSLLDVINWEEIKSDPGLRKQIDDYHPNLR